MKTVVIVGAGFGGLQCARALANRPVRVLVLDRNDYHLFTPLLYQVASSLLNPSDIAYPIRSIVRRGTNVGFRVAEVTEVDPADNAVRTASGDVEHYDYLVLATGASINFFGDEAIASSAYHLTTLPSALELRNHALRCFEAAERSGDPATRAGWLTFVVVGGGPTGVEYAGALAELVRLIAGRDYPSLPRAAVRIVLLEGGERVLPAFSAPLGNHARKRLARLGVDVRLAARLHAMDGNIVRLANGESFAANTLVWAAGVQANTFGAADSLPRRGTGRIEVDECLRVPGCVGVFAVGDAAGCMQGEGELPMLSAPAMQQGKAVARAILRDLDGKQPQPFRYRDKGIMATIGRNSGVAQLGRMSLRGFPGWIAWLLVHLYFIIGFRNRIAVLIGWAWNYILYDRPIRFVVRAADREESPHGTGVGKPG